MYQNIVATFIKQKLHEMKETSSQDGGVWRHGSPLHITTSKSQLKYRTTIIQTIKKIELNGSLTTTELKKPHPSGLVGGVQMWNRLASHPCVVDKNSGGLSWEQGVPAHQALQPRVPVPGRYVPNNFWLQKPVGIESVEEAAGALSNSSWGTHHFL